MNASQAVWQRACREHDTATDRNMKLMACQMWTVVWRHTDDYITGNMNGGLGGLGESSIRSYGARAISVFSG